MDGLHLGSGPRDPDAHYILCSILMKFLPPFSG